MSYRRDIDGLRALAVLLVVGFHAFPTIDPGGYVGVDVFFVISGYLITGIILEPLQTRTFSAADFYRRRIRRLFPALFVVLAGVWAAGSFLLSPPALARLGEHIASGAAFFPNLVFWGESGYFDAAASQSPLRHLWSLGVEEQFYLVWPLVLYLLVRFTRSVLPGLLIATVGSFVACMAIVRVDSAEAFYSPFTRAWELGIGALLMVASLEGSGVARRRLAEAHSSLTSAIGLTLIGGSAVLLTGTSTFPGWLALMPTAGTILIVASGERALVNRLLSRKAFVAVGLISYPLYLWHWPLISFAYIHANGTPAVSIRLVAVGVSFLLAASTFWFLERPIRRRRNTTTQAYALAGLMAAVGCLGLVTDLTAGFRARLPVEMQAVLRYAAYNYAGDARANRCWLSASAAFSAYAQECFLDPGNARTDGVLVWGDSHAARLYPGIRNVLGSRANIGQLTRDSCPPLLGLSAGTCEKSNARIVQLVASEKPHTVLLFALWTSYGDWSAGSRDLRLLRRTLTTLRRAGVKQIVLLGPAPKWVTDLPTLLYENWEAQTSPRSIPERLGSGLDKRIYAADSMLARIPKSSEITFVSLLGLLCNGDGCLTYLPGSAGKLFTWDYGHLTTDGATFVAKRLLAENLLP